MKAERDDYGRKIDMINPRTARIETLLERYYNSAVRICPLRSHLATLSWKETEGQPVHIRRARLFEKICDEIPVAIFDGELIVGAQTAYPRGVGLQLDFSPRVGFEIEEGDRRLRAEQTEGFLDDADLQTVIEDSHYWQDKAPGEIMLRQIREIMGSTFEDVSVGLCTRSYGSNSISSPDADFAKVLRLGLSGIRSEIDSELAGIQFTSTEDGTKFHLLTAARLCIDAEIRLAKRYAELARNMAAVETDTTRKKELEEIAQTCGHVPENPPRNFREALQSVRFILLGLYLEEGNGSGIPLGRMDQYLYPFYQADNEQGTMTRDEAAELLASFWIKVAATDAITPAGIKISGAGYLNTRIVLGGVDRQGNDACNELTRMILHVAGNMKVGMPVYLRWHKGMSREIMLKAAWTNKEVGSEPAFHNDEQIIPALVADGVALEDARDYVIEGCANPFPYGGFYGTYHFMNGPKILELVMNNGCDPKTDKPIGIETGDPLLFKSIDDWVRAFTKQWDYIYDIVLKGYKIGELTKMTVYSQPFTSALIADCMQKGLDVNAGGVRYPQFTGDIYNKVFADVADSLTAIDRLVYKERKIAIDELLKVCDDNFEGNRGEQVRAMLAAAPKFGNDSGEPEEMYRLLNDHVSAYGRSQKGYFGYPKRDARLGGAVHSSMGLIVGALPNGRKAGIPLADGGISPCAGCDTQGPTVTLRSVAKALDYTTNRSAVLNQKMPKSMMRTDAEMNRFVDLIETFFRDYNGYQVQWNIEDRDIYLAAKENPAEYKNLIVRVGGFSAYFVELDPLLQDEIIARTEQTFKRDHAAA
jgi:pyruvate formate-lyase/glycerol dehydratase family glycyl radical enzyme